jgi:hypothetical protein
VPAKPRLMSIGDMNEVSLDDLFKAQAQRARARI